MQSDNTCLTPSDKQNVSFRFKHESMFLLFWDQQSERMIYTTVAMLQLNELKGEQREDPKQLEESIIFVNTSFRAWASPGIWLKSQWLEVIYDLKLFCVWKRGYVLLEWWQMDYLEKCPCCVLFRFLISILFTANEWEGLAVLYPWKLSENANLLSFQPVESTSTVKLCPYLTIHAVKVFLRQLRLTIFNQ